MKEGNEKEFHGNYSVGIISSKFNIEGPLIKDRSSFNLSARRTYIDFLTRPFVKNRNDILNYYFYDLNAKINYRFSDRSRLFLSSYSGKDKTYSGWDENNSYEKDQIFWGNITTALRWNYTLTPRLFSNTTVSFSNYNYNIGAELKSTDSGSSEYFNFKYRSGIYDYSYKIDFDYFPNQNHSVKFGINYIRHKFIPGINTFKSNQSEVEPVNLTYGDKKITADEIAFYAEDDITILNRFKTNLGLHYSGFNVQHKFYNSLEPRISLHYIANNELSFKAAYSRMQQYIHLLTSSSINLPTDLWLPATKRVKPQYSEQYAAGSTFKLTNEFDVSIESFYKAMNNLIEYKEGATFFGSAKGWEDKVEIGKGWSYGAELMVSKEIGKTTGWVSYTLSWANRQFENINFGKVFPARYDRRHDLSLVLSHKFNDRFDISGTWVFGTGNVVTLATHKIETQIPNNNITTWGNFSSIDYFDGRNNYRMPPFHRLDLGFNFHKQKKNGIRTWNIGIFNAYNRKNPFYLHLSKTYNYEEKKSEPKLKQVSLFPIMPSISYNYKF